jgi:hypothetical protein
MAAFLTSTSKSLPQLEPTRQPLVTNGALPSSLVVAVDKEALARLIRLVRALALVERL